MTRRLSLFLAACLSLSLTSCLTLPEGTTVMLSYKSASLSVGKTPAK